VELPSWPGRWATGAAVVIVAALVSGAITWQLTQPSARLTDVAQGQPAVSASPAAGIPSAVAPVNTGPAPVNSGPPPASPNGVTVAIAPGAAPQPGATQVAAFITGYFNAINQRDYQGYMGKFDDQARPDYTRPKFLAEFSSTTDTAPALTALSPAGGGLLATVTFTSHQNAAQSFTHTACTAWTQRLYLVTSGGSYLIGQSPPGSPQTTARAC
jgi:hypothetical protein